MIQPFRYSGAKRPTHVAGAYNGSAGTVLFGKTGRPLTKVSYNRTVNDGQSDPLGFSFLEYEKSVLEANGRRHYFTGVDTGGP